MADWTQPFDDPVPLPDGGSLRILREAGEFIAALSEKDQRQSHWQTAAHMLLLAAEGRGPVMHARIAMLRALHHGEPPRPPEPRRKHAKAFKIVR